MKRSLSALLSAALVAASPGRVLAGPITEAPVRDGQTGVLRVPVQLGQSGGVSLTSRGGVSISNGGQAASLSRPFNGLRQQRTDTPAALQAVVPAARANAVVAVEDTATGGNVVNTVNTQGDGNKEETDGEGKNPLTAQADKEVEAIAQSEPVKAALDSSGNQLAGLNELYVAAGANLAPGEFLALPNGDGPAVFHGVYRPRRTGFVDQPSGIPPAEFLAGRTPVFVVFGTGYSSVEAFDRPFVRDYLLRAVQYIREKHLPGLRLVLVDRPENNPWQGENAKNKPPEIDFVADDRIAGNIEDTALLQDIGQQVLQTVQGMNQVVVGAGAPLNPYISFAAVLPELVRDSGMNPYILVNPYSVVRSMQDKSIFRQKVNENAPWMKLDSRILAYPAEFDQVRALAKQARPSGWRSLPGRLFPRLATKLPMGNDPQSKRIREKWWQENAVPLMEPAVERMLAIFREIQAQNPGKSFVMKPRKSAGKAVIRTDITEENAREVYLSIFKEDLFTWSQNAKLRSSFTLPDRYDVQQERQIKGHGEYDTELVIRILGNGLIEVLGFVIGNALPVPKTMSELGMTWPALLSKELAQALILDAVESLLAVTYPRLPFGNTHGEMMLDGGTTPFPIEMNYTRPVGGNYGVPLVFEWSLIDLILQGMLANLGLPLAPIVGQPKRAVTLKKLTPTMSGYLAEISVPPALRQYLSKDGLAKRPGGDPDDHSLDIQIFLPKTDPTNPKTWPEVHDPRAEENAFGTANGYIVAWSGEGQPPEEAIALAFDAMGQMEFVITPSLKLPWYRRIPMLRYLIQSVTGEYRPATVRLPVSNLFHPDDAELRFPRPN